MVKQIAFYEDAIANIATVNAFLATLTNSTFTDDNGTNIKVDFFPSDTADEINVIISWDVVQ